MSYRNTKTQWSARNIADYYESKVVTFDNVIQRGLVWTSAQKSLFIHSLAISIPVGCLYANEKGKKYDVLDGKQRMTTIYQYLNDMFVLKDVPPAEFLDKKQKKKKEDVNGKKFSELSKELQDIIGQTMFDVIIFSDMSQEEAKELFIRLNNGKALSPKAKALANCVDIDHLIEIGKHPVFVSMLSQKRRDNKEEVAITMKTWIMLNEKIDSISFLAEDFYKKLREVKISATEEKEIKKIFDYTDEVYEEMINRKKKRVAKRMLKETHFVSLVPYIKQAVEKKVKVEDFADWIIYFYGVKETISVSEPYNQASMQGVARNSNIKIRDDELKKSFKKQIK